MAAVTTSSPFNRALDHIPDSAGHNNYEHCLTLCTNEANQVSSLTKIGKLASNGDTLFGSSSLFVLNAAVESPLIQYIIIGDCSDRAAHFWREMTIIIPSCATAKECHQQLIALSLKNSPYYYGGGDQPPLHIHRENMKNLEAEKARHNSWLSSEQSFQKIQRIFTSQQFLFKRIDLCDTSLCKRIAETLQERGNNLHTLYLGSRWRTVPREVLRFSYLQSIMHFTQKELLPVTVDKTQVLVIQIIQAKNNSTFLYQAAQAFSTSAEALSTFFFTPPSIYKVVEEATLLCMEDMAELQEPKKRKASEIPKTQQPDC